MRRALCPPFFFTDDLILFPEMLMSVAFENIEFIYPFPLIFRTAEREREEASSAQKGHKQAIKYILGFYSKTEGGWA